MLVYECTQLEHGQRPLLEEAIKSSLVVSKYNNDTLTPFNDLKRS